MIRPRARLRIHYPRTTHVAHIQHAQTRERIISVREVRDLVRDPLTVAEFMRRPFLNRSRLLVLGFDQDKEQPRQFYLGSSVEYRTAGTLRLIVDGVIVSRGFDATREDRKELLSWVRRLDDTEDLRIQCDDLRVA